MRLSRGLALAVWLGSGAVLSSTTSGTGFNLSGVAYGSGCAPLTASSSNQTASAGFGTFANMEKSFTNARSAEGCNSPLDLTANQGISQATWNGYTPRQQVFALYNAERQDRGISLLKLDTTLMSQIDFNHSHEMNQYSYFAHSSPIDNPFNHPGDTFGRLTINPAINNFSALGENIAGNSSAAAAVFEFMYDDGSQGWDHRLSILGYTGSGFGQYNWVGVGVSTSHTYGLLFTTDFLQSSSYSPPAAADTSAPTMSSPTASGSPGGTVTASAANVVDSGASAGAAALTGVRFYAGSSGNPTTPITVAGTQSGTTWTASLNQPAGTAVHAVAVDGSGNYTDCTVGGGCVSSVSASPTAAHVTHLAVSRHGAQTTFRWSVSSNHQIAGFNLYAGMQRLNARLIPSMQRTSFRYSTLWSGLGGFRLEIVMSNGEVVRVAAW